MIACCEGEHDFRHWCIVEHGHTAGIQKKHVHACAPAHTHAHAHTHILIAYAVQAWEYLDNEGAIATTKPDGSRCFIFWAATGETAALTQPYNRQNSITYYVHGCQYIAVAAVNPRALYANGGVQAYRRDCVSLKYVENRLSRAVKIGRVRMLCN